MNEHEDEVNSVLEISMRLTKLHILLRSSADNQAIEAERDLMEQAFYVWRRTYGEV